MRFYYRIGRSSGVSVGLVGGVLLLILVAAMWFYVALFAAACLLLYGVWWGVLRLSRKVRR
jgi:hypothetical protein